MSDSPKLKKIIGLFFFFILIICIQFLYQRAQRCFILILECFLGHIEFISVSIVFPVAVHFIQGLVVWKKKVRNKQQNQKFFRNGSRTAIYLFALFKQTLPLFSQLQYAWFKDTRPCGLKKKEGNRERRTKSKVFRMFEAMCTATSLFALFNCPPKRGQSYGVFQMWFTRVKIFD